MEAGSIVCCLTLPTALLCVPVNCTLTFCHKHDKHQISTMLEVHRDMKKYIYYINIIEGQSSGFSIVWIKQQQKNIKPRLLIFNFVSQKLFA